MVLDDLNKVLANVATNRAQCVLKRQQLEQQLIEVPNQIQAQIDKANEAIAEMDAAIAAVQVVITDEHMLAETQAQIIANASPLSTAAASSSAADEASATETSATGSDGSDGLADQSGSAGGHSDAAANA